MTESLERLINIGFEVVREPQKSAAERTIIVLGVARGGTSMIAAVLANLGIPMGVGRESVVFEDVELANAIDSKDFALLESVIESRNAKHAVWGFKRPSASLKMNRLAKSFRNPYFVVVFRDIFAIALRNKIAVKTDPYRDMHNSLRQYAEILDFIQSTRLPTMLVSYEKALLKREAFVRALAAFVGIHDEVAINASFKAVEPEPEKYLKNARSAKVIGVLDPLRKQRVGGWAKPNSGEHAITVELFINGSKAMEIVADRMRVDVKEKGIHPTGRCGFLFELEGMPHLEDGDVVSVRAKGDVRDLNSSPRTFGADSGGVEA